MLTPSNIHMVWPEAAPAATVVPCPNALDTERRFGYNPTLAERCAR
jgi:hypothetical protein